ncbi:response regulator [Parasulfuritortus cantonensis]|uniref:Response regulator n=1 Tax=Parasulfuritortus cantonensis TaxID=2528202 RepID=A0A4R1B8B4_9PROT|nr:tetratricopeptide repeat-containing response regulator [Parasulfuritortus cantonensis]TCJ12333.1 response regulator [Parasulfuritortus cantonensis]
MALADPAPAFDYKSKTALVIDDFPSMRAAFKTALAAFGLTKVDMAATAAEAISRVKRTRYDIIISDYNLGGGRDGQQVLEEMRHLGLIGLETAFLMVTAESVYERVVAAAELAPDDYLIKPFNADIMRTRLDGILAKKETFRQIHRDFMAGHMEAALAGCDGLIKGRSKYLIDAMRFKGEVLVAMGRHDEAGELYEQVIRMRAVPWARLGLARTLQLRNRLPEAERLLVTLVGQYPELVSGYDLLADVQVAMDKSHEAQVTLKRGVTMSPRSVQRQRRLGQVSYKNQDIEEAEGAFGAVVSKGKNSIYLAPDDFANLSRVYLETERGSDALRVIQDNQSWLQESTEGKLVASVMTGLYQARKGNVAEAERHMKEALRHRQMGADGKPELLLDMAEACLKSGLDEQAAQLVSEVARNAHDSEQLLDQAKRIYAAAGKGSEIDEVIRKATEQVARLSKEGALLAQKGDLVNATGTLLQAAQQAPRNPRVLMNAAWVALRLMEEDAGQSQHLAEVRALLEEAWNIAPDHPRIGGLQTKLRLVEAKLGFRSVPLRKKGPSHGRP